MEWHGRVKLAASSSDSLRGEPLLVMMALSTFLAIERLYPNLTTIEVKAKILGRNKSRFKARDAAVKGEFPLS